MAWIKNKKDLALTPERKVALSLVEAAFEAIETKKVIRKNFKIKDNELVIKNKKFNLKKFKKISVIGFGKVSCLAALEIENILGKKISQGVVIGETQTKCEIIKTYAGTHPLPSRKNFLITKDLIKIASGASKDDLVIVVVSGGGSALLCWPETECSLGKKLYLDSIKSDIPIEELNILRKHLSGLKGGGLAKILYPATVVSLIFCDVPSNRFEMVASGPTYYDSTTIKDAEKIAKKYNFKGYSFNETPKENIYFKKVFNIPLLSNLDALNGMKKKANELGLRAKILSSDISRKQDQAVKIFSSVNFRGVILAGGEPEAAVPKNHGKGGRNQELTLKMLSKLKDKEVFISFGSDGWDNSPAAGAIADALTLKKAEKLKLNPNDFARHFDAFNFFKKTGDLIITGKTNENVSDLMILLKKVN
jgi:glycerate-2-kinase